MIKNSDLSDFIKIKTSEFKNLLDIYQESDMKFFYQNLSFHFLEEFMKQKVYSQKVLKDIAKGIYYIYGLNKVEGEAAYLSLENLIKTGLGNFKKAEDNFPPKRVEQLTQQLTFLLKDYMKNRGLKQIVPYLNILYAPFLEGMGFDELKYVAKSLLYQARSESNGNFFPQDICFEIELGFPKSLKNKKVGQGDSIFNGNFYSDYTDIADLFAIAMVETIGENLPQQNMPGFPISHLVVMMDETIDISQKEILRTALKVSHKNPHLKIQIKSRRKKNKERLLEESLFYGIKWQRVAINLPQLVYRVKALEESALEKIVQEVLSSIVISFLDKKKALLPYLSLGKGVKNFDEHFSCRIELLGMESALRFLYDDSFRSKQVYAFVDIFLKESERLMKKHSIYIDFDVFSKFEAHHFLMKKNDIFDENINKQMDRTYQTYLDFQIFDNSFINNIQTLKDRLKSYKKYGWSADLDILNTPENMQDKTWKALRNLLQVDGENLQEEIFHSSDRLK
ncbi:hypothetical protein AB834_04545 [PVC group bacterium (ex Bugula neritina AB1)]|nr:hypothetical protein AB834_04545 [PVC group bacterium (ex Bugula neritina AB1)]